MAVFCSRCGAPLGEGTKFCDKCGTAVGGQPAGVGAPAPSPTAVYPAPVPAKGTSTTVKVVIGILTVFVFFGLLVVGSCFYIGYRVKQRAQEYTKQMGNVPPYTGRREPCAMLTTDEASSAIGQAVSSAEPRSTIICDYRFGENGKHLAIQYTWQGGAMAMAIAHGAMNQFSSVAALTPLQGIGDEAYLGPMGSSLMMRKGDVMVNMNLQVSGVSPDAAEKLAKIIGDRL
jgi:zinc-ribbon domain